MPASPVAGPLVAVDDGLDRPPARSVGLEAAPTIVGGVAAPSEIAVGVPNDLDLICRMTLGSGRRGPISPGDLALQIAPWPAEQAIVRRRDAACGLRGRDDASPSTRRGCMPVGGRRRQAPRGAAAAAGARRRAGPAEVTGCRRGRRPRGEPTASTALLRAPAGARSPEPADAAAPDASRPASPQPGLPPRAWPAPSATGSAPSPAPRPTRPRPEPPSVGPPARRRRRDSTNFDDVGGEDIDLADALEEAPRDSPRAAAAGLRPRRPGGSERHPVAHRPRDRRRARARGALHRHQQRHEDRPARRRRPQPVTS